MGGFWRARVREEAGEGCSAAGRQDLVRELTDLL